jgi:hypothetical protein
MYQITTYSYTQAKRLKVIIKPSKLKGKKIDVFENGKKIASIGAHGMGDYPTYIKTKGKKYADTRRKLYKTRHESNRHKERSPGFYADQILW